MLRRYFHIWEFPKHIRVKLNEHTYERLFNECKAQYGSLKTCAKHLDISYGKLIAWKNLRLFVPLWAVEKLISKISLSWVNIERNIVAYKGRNLSHPITNPVLPIEESPELLGVITHLICDGCVNKIGNPSYVNTEKALISNLKLLLSRSFGLVPGKEYNRSAAVFYNFSKTVVEIIQHFYNIGFKSGKAFLPEELFNLSDEHACEVVRAIIDDEGTVRDNRITVSMKDKTIVLQLERLLINLLGGKSVSKVIVRDNYCSISVNSDGLREFLDKINLRHPKKAERLKHAVNHGRENGMGCPRGETKGLILESLRKNAATPFDLYKVLDVACANVNTHLKQLRQQGLVERRRKGYGFIWKLTDKGKITKNI